METQVAEITPFNDAKEGQKVLVSYIAGVFFVESYEDIDKGKPLGLVKEIGLTDCKFHYHKGGYLNVVGTISNDVLKDPLITGARYNSAHVITGNNNFDLNSASAVVGTEHGFVAYQI